MKSRPLHIFSCFCNGLSNTDVWVARGAVYCRRYGRELWFQNRRFRSRNVGGGGYRRTTHILFPFCFVLRVDANPACAKLEVFTVLFFEVPNTREPPLLQGFQDYFRRIKASGSGDLIRPRRVLPVVYEQENSKTGTPKYTAAFDAIPNPSPDIPRAWEPTEIFVVFAGK